MSNKILWNTVKIMVPSDFITVTDKAKKDFEKTKVNPEQLEKRRAYAKKYYQQKKEKLEKEYWENMYREFIVSTD